MNAPERLDDGPLGGTPTLQPRRCERCQQQAPALVWLWGSKKFCCPVCAVHEAYDDALKIVVEEMTARRDPTGSPFLFATPEEALRRVATKIQRRPAEQLQGDPTPPRHNR